ncbi:MAG: hypothetical protein AAF928_08450 [Myxococcota bacterium]
MADERTPPRPSPTPTNGAATHGAARGASAEKPRREGGITLAGLTTVAMDLDEAHPPGMVTEAAANAIRYILASTKVEPDFSLESLALVDHYVTEARVEMMERPEVLPLTAQTLGAYLGEIVRRRHACWWRIDRKDPGAWRLEFHQVYLAFYPIQVAYVCLTEEDDDTSFGGLEMPPADLDNLRDRLDRTPGVSEDLYYVPTTRLEVLDIAVDALLAQRATRPDVARPYTARDYAI